MKKAVEANCNRDKRFGESDLMKWKICRKTGEAWIFFFFLLRLFEFEFFSLCCSPLCTNHQNGEFWQTVLLGPKEGTKSNHCYMWAWSQATPLLDKYTLLDLGMLCFCSDNRVLATDTHIYIQWNAHDFILCERLYQRDSSFLILVEGGCGSRYIWVNMASLSRLSGGSWYPLCLGPSVYLPISPCILHIQSLRIWPQSPSF